MLCDFVFDPDGDRLKATCARCGRVARVKSRRVYAACRAAEVPLTPNQLAEIVNSGADPDGWKPLPIGDLVEKALTSVGITKERVERLTRTSGKLGGCGCDGRKKWLNEVGAKVQYAVRDAGKAAAEFYFGQ